MKKHSKQPSPIFSALTSRKPELDETDYANYKALVEEPEVHPAVNMKEALSIDNPAHSMHTDGAGDALDLPPELHDAIIDKASNRAAGSKIVAEQDGPWKDPVFKKVLDHVLQKYKGRNSEK